jgi:phosphinothricin acetyltransferase
VDIRPGQGTDLEQINEIYNFYVRSSYATFDIDPTTVDERRGWFDQFDEVRHRLFVADDGGVLGFAYSAKWLSTRKAYETSVSTTVYVADGCQGRGIGRALYRALFDALDGQDLHRAYAGIALPNDASVALHTSFGFKQVALFSEQGRKFDRYWDVAWFEKELR